MPDGSVYVGLACPAEGPDSVGCNDLSTRLHLTGFKRIWWFQRLTIVFASSLVQILLLAQGPWPSDNTNSCALQKLVSRLIEIQKSC